MHVSDSPITHCAGPPPEERRSRRQAPNLRPAKVVTAGCAFLANCHRSMAELVARHALHWCTSAPVTLATRVHAGRDLLLQHVTRFHGSVAFGTTEPGLDMRRMAKEDKIWNAIDRHPGDVLALLRGSPEFRNLGAIRLNRPMACQAEVDRRESRIIALGSPHVAEAARKTNFPRMNLVTECHWLRSYRMGKPFLRPPRHIFLGECEGAKKKAKEKPTRRPGPSPPGFRALRIPDHFTSASPLGKANATILPVKTLSYLLPPPAAITTNCRPDFFPI